MKDTLTTLADSSARSNAELDTLQSTIEVPISRVAGEPLAWTPRTDDVITLLLMVSVFSMAWVAVQSWNFVVRSAADFFYNLIPRRAIPTDESDIDDVGNNFLLHLHVCFLIALAFVCYKHALNPEIFADKAPYLLIFKAAGLTALWYGVRAVLYRFIDSVFFEQWQHLLWHQTRIQSVFLSSFLLLVIVVVEIYFVLPPTIYILALLLYILLSRMVLFMKCYSTFFYYRGGFFHLLIYFCTLEIAPLAALWRLLEAAS